LSLQKLSSIFVCLVISNFMAAAQSAPQVEHVTTIAERAAAAKASGSREAAFPFPGVIYPIVPSGLIHASSQFSLVVGTPRATQTVIQDEAWISTWYSIAIDEVIVEHPCSLCSLLTIDGLPASMRPAKLLPVPAHSLLLIRRGGSVRMDGVDVTETERGVAALTVGKKYLFVVDKSPKGMARLVLNDAGIFVVGQDGDTLAPISGPGDSTKTKFPTLTELRSDVHPAPAK
jgi:hypothetical protein